MVPVTSRFSITAPSCITLIDPVGVSFVPAGTPVFVALGFGPEHTETLPPLLVELDVLAEPPLEELGLAEPPPTEGSVVPEEPPPPAEPVVVDAEEVSLLLHAAPAAMAAAVRTKR